jgi:two-component system phosphate regulon sensor histidine kinase PhoR
MVGELLELSRIESGELPVVKEPVSLSRIVFDAVDRMQSQAERMGIELRVDAPETLPPVLGDAERLERAVVNLVHNALKFTPAGGTIEVTVRGERGSARVDVKDSGVGIETRDLPRIFERFYKSDGSRRTDGSGLGLALVKHTIEAHGGSVSVTSEPSRGSTFTLTLPLLDATVAPAGLEAFNARSAT